MTINNRYEIGDPIYEGSYATGFDTDDDNQEQATNFFGSPIIGARIIQAPSQEAEYAAAAAARRQERRNFVIPAPNFGGQALYVANPQSPIAAANILQEQDLNVGNQQTPTADVSTNTPTAPFNNKRRRISDESLDSVKKKSRIANDNLDSEGSTTDENTSNSDRSDSPTLDL